ncbi:MAG: hypothetical protein ACREOV_12840 [Candidatus Dormibacteraceae bacterium]
MFSRSPRTMVRLAIWLVVGALAVAGAGVLVAELGVPAGVLLVVLALLPLPLAVQQCLQAHRLSTFRIGLFRDRLILLGEEGEREVRWAEIETAMLGDTSEWATVAWPEIVLSSRLTLRRFDGSALRFRPSEVGLAPIACRDLVLRCRDEEASRLRLPAYDPLVPLGRRPARSGERLQPVL